MECTETTVARQIGLVAITRFTRSRLKSLNDETSYSPHSGECVALSDAISGAI
jgi:hypothetical protein